MGREWSKSRSVVAALSVISVFTEILFQIKKCHLTSGAAAPDQFAYLVAQLHEFHQRARGPGADLAVPGSRGFEELRELTEPFSGIWVRRLVFVRLRDAFAEHVHGGIDFAFLSLVEHHQL